MATGSYKVILTGEFDGTRERAEIHAALVALFKLSDAEVDRLLDSAPVTIKTGLDHSTASQYKSAIERTGALCELREAGDSASASASPAVAAPAKPSMPATAAASSPHPPDPAPQDTPRAAPDQQSGSRASGPPASPPTSPQVIVRVVGAGRGLSWWGEGWRLFMQAPGVWFVISFIMMVSIIFLQIIPLVGFLAAALLPPLFAGGVMLGAQQQSTGGAIRIEHLFAGFSRRTGPLLALGGMYIAGSILLSVLVIALLGAAMLGANMDIGPDLEDPEVLFGVIASTTGLLALLLAMLGGFVLMGALWFAPALVMLRDVAPLAAMKASLWASMRNWLAFLVYGLLMIVLSLIAIAPFGLGYLLLMPVLLASVFAAYQDVFDD